MALAIPDNNDNAVLGGCGGGGETLSLVDESSLELVLLPSVTYGVHDFAVVTEEGILDDSTLSKGEIVRLIVLPTVAIDILESLVTRFSRAVVVVGALTAGETWLLLRSRSGEIDEWTVDCDEPGDAKICPDKADNV